MEIFEAIMITKLICWLVGHKRREWVITQVDLQRRVVDGFYRQAETYCFRCGGKI